MKTPNGDSIYHGKDGRLRVYVYETKKTVSYPKYLMEKELGRALLPGEDVHHKDGDPLNNDTSNLVVKSHSEHTADHMTKYHDTIAFCGWCGKEFLWTAKHQKSFYSNKRNHGQKTDVPFCSRECSGQYGKHIQGDHSPRRKLSDDQVRYIRENYIPYDKNFGLNALARQFDVDRSVVDCIIKGSTYKEIL